VESGLGQQQRLSQTQTLAPQLRQGLRLLAMSLPDLRSELVAEMSRNPVIEDVDPTLERTTLSQKESEQASADATPDYPDADDALDAARMEGFSRPDDYVIGSRCDRRTVPDAEAIERRQKLFDNFAVEETLVHHLMAQLDASDVPEEDRPLAEILIGELDNDGRFTGDLDEILSVVGETPEKAEALLAQIRAFDPPGCGARTLRECLEAQLDRIADAALRSRVAALLARLDDVARGRVDDAEALKALRSLDPRPGRAFRAGAHDVELVNPELHVERCADGWIARVDARSLPEIRISSRYLAMLEDPETAPETRAYVRERIAAAKALVEAVAKRRETVERIAQEIVDRQPGFFEQGLKGLKPMTMQEVADAVGVHGTTVSRTVNGKYVATPRGTVELRRFFTNGVVSDSGEAVSRDGILARLQTLVDEEDPAHPLSDESLSKLLKADGFAVARRTVAKYRALAGIPGTSERRSP
jgi:RNA polymerase sigma-54 factor